MSSSSFDLALNDPDFHLGDVDAVYRRLRAEAPVCWCGRAGMWAIARYADIQHVSRNPQQFCSGRGVIINDPMRDGTMPPGALSIIYLDPPAHNRYRRLVSKAFTPRMVAALEERVREITRQSLDAVPPEAVVDFVEHVAVPLPMLVIAELLGVAGEDRADFRRWSDAMIAGADLGSAATMETVSQLFQYFFRTLEERRRTPRADLVSALATAELDGERLADDEILMFCVTLLVAGNETTRNLISGGARALAEFPDQRRKLLADPSRIANGVEEMLRWVTPVKAFARTAVADTTLGGQSIAAGDYLVLLYGSANRDEAVWGPTADCFDVMRSPEPGHLAFGFGQHLCLGANLARLEARILFEELLARFPTFAVAGPVERLRSTVINGIVRMPVRLQP